MGRHNDHKTVIRGDTEYSMANLRLHSGVDLALGVLNKNHTSVENTCPMRALPGSQVNNLLATCGLQLGGRRFPTSRATAPALATGK